MPSSSGRSGGLVGSVKRLTSSVLEAFSTRAELFTVELHEEKIRIIQAIVLAISGTFLSIIALVMITLTVIASVPDDWKLLSALLFCLLYVAGSVFCFFRLKQMLEDGPKPFGHTIEQLKKDQQCLKP